MVEEVFPGIYKTVLKNTTLEQGVSEINIFLIPGKEGERSLMIDAGFRQELCLKELESCLSELKISPEMLDVFLTHRHHDHSGLAGILAERGARLFMNREEERHPYDCLTYKPTPESAKAQEAVLRRAGVTREDTPELFACFQKVTDLVRAHGDWVLAVTSFPYINVCPGDSFDYGDYHFETIPLKGHTYGQMGLMDPEKKLFFSADQLIAGLSPIVATTYPDEHLLQSFFDSLEYIKRRCIEGWTVFSAHGEKIPGGDAVKRAVDKSVFSYLEKCSKVKEILSEQGEMTTRRIMEICYHVQDYPKDEPSFFKYKMTLTKTYSLLEYLHDIDFVERREADGIFYWQRKEL